MKTKDTVIPSGYRLTVTTWENDADNYRTVVKEGLSKSDADFFTDLCKAFLHSTDYAGRICNIHEADETDIVRVYSVIVPIMLKHAQTEHQLTDPEDPDDDELCLIGDECSEFLYDLGISGGEFYTRVVESFKVEYVDTPITLKNVTAEFE